MKSYELYSKLRLSKFRCMILLCCFAFGLLLMFLCSKVSRLDIEAIAVSSNEQYIAFFETGNGHKIRCFHIDGTQMFNFEILPDLSAGGYCTLWFEETILCVFFYRTNKTVQISLNGNILNVFNSAGTNKQGEFSNFIKKRNQYIFTGEEIKVIYYKRNIWERLILSKERCLFVSSKKGNIKIVLGTD